MKDIAYISAPILKADVPNSNGRIYPLAALENCIAEEAKRKPLLGVIGMDEGLSISLDKVSHIAENLRIEGDTLVADIRVVNTPAGNQLIELYKSGLITFRSSGFGKIGADGKTITDFEPISINAVYDGAEL
jgi:hypothetical protein